MLITEKDLFNYVFYIDQVPTEKSQTILNNYHLFKDELEFLKSLLDSLSKEIVKENWENIKKRIEKNTKFIFFNLRKEIVKKKGEINDHLVLAAASPTIESVNKTETFKDDDSNFLVKSIRNNDETKLYFFSKEYKEINNFNVEIKPADKSFFVASSNNPLIIKDKCQIEGILVTLSLE